MKKLSACILFLAMLLCLTACGQATETLTLTGITGLWFTEEMPGDSGSEIDPDVLRVGRTYDGRDIFALVRVPLPEEIWAIEAWLSLKPLESNGAQALLAGTLSGPWEEDITCGQARALAGELLPARQALTRDGRVRIDITGHVRAWLGGEANYGLALFEANDSTETVFFAGEGEDEPRLEIIIQK